MAKKEETTKIVLERVYNIPLRRQFLKAAKWRRTEKAITALKQFIAKHMKSKDIAIGRYVNKEIWKNGIQNPPHHIKVTATKDEKGRVMVELTELSPNAKRQIEKASQLKKKDEKAKKEAKKEEPKKEESPTEKIEDKIEEATKEKEENAKKDFRG